MNSYAERTQLAFGLVDMGIALPGECYLPTETWELHPGLSSLIGGERADGGELR